MATIQSLVIMKIDFLDKYLYLQFESWIEKETMKGHIWKFHLLVIALFCYNERWPGKVSVALLIRRALMSTSILMLFHAMWTTMLMLLVTSNPWSLSLALCLHHFPLPATRDTQFTCCEDEQNWATNSVFWTGLQLWLEFIIKLKKLWIGHDKTRTMCSVAWC